MNNVINFMEYKKNRSEELEREQMMIDEAYDDAIKEDLMSWSFSYDLEDGVTEFWDLDTATYTITVNYEDDE